MQRVNVTDKHQHVQPHLKIFDTIQGSIKIFLNYASFSSNLKSFLNTIYTLTKNDAKPG